VTFLPISLSILQKFFPSSEVSFTPQLPSSATRLLSSAISYEILSWFQLVYGAQTTTLLHGLS
jgi:hypothetical protein